MHIHFLDPYQHGVSPIHRLDPRVKFILTLAFILTAALTPVGAWPVYVLLFALILSVELLSELGVTHVAKSKGYMLSGGERRRVEICRSLVTQPKFILLDEPFAGVDPIAVEDIQKIVAGLRDKGIGVLITDHNVHETLSITDRAYLLFDGQVLKSGTADYLANDSEARKLYLGEQFTLNR